MAMAVGAAEDDALPASRRRQHHGYRNSGMQGGAGGADFPGNGAAAAHDETLAR